MSVHPFVGRQMSTTCARNLAASAIASNNNNMYVFCCLWRPELLSPQGRSCRGRRFSFVLFLCLLFLWLLLIQSPGRGCSPPRPSYMCRMEAARMQGLDPPLRATTGLRSAHVRREFARVPSRCWSWYSSYGRVSPREAASSKN